MRHDTSGQSSGGSQLSGASQLGECGWGARRGSSGVRGLRILLVLGLAVGLSGQLLRLSWSALADLSGLAHSPSATPADAVADVAAVVALAAWVWLLAGAIVTTLEALGSRPAHGVARRIAPAWWRRAVLAAVGIGVLSAPMATTHATPGEGPTAARIAAEPTSDSAGADRRLRQVLDGLPFPDRPSSQHGVNRSATASTAPQVPARQAQQRVTVRAGDSLWAIAAHHLGPSATDASIAAEWRRWYAANRACIGPNPHLIQPGMVLHAPGDGRSGRC